MFSVCECVCDNFLLLLSVLLLVHLLWYAKKWLGTMGNKLCKKKADGVDTVDNSKSSAGRFDRIFSRLNLRPNSWKSDSHLNRKEVNRVNAMDSNNKPNNICTTQPLSKSSDWTNVDLEVPEKEQTIHLRNPKLTLIFNNNDGTPTPPPRKHKKNFREKIEAVAKSIPQAFQSSKKPVDEPLCIKKKYNYDCPLCNSDEANHNHHHHHPNNVKNEEKSDSKASKRRKNLSVVSLPNYNELKLTVATFDDIDKKPNDDNLHNSLNIDKKISTASSGKLDNYITRCRSFGSLLPQQLMEKLRVKKAPTDIESDDSFGGLEDWDIGFIEHYNPKDTSLPRARKLPPKDKRDVLAGVESLIVQDVEEPKPKVPVRRSESLIKRLNRQKALEASKAAEAPKTLVPTAEPAEVEHSTLMKILEEFSIKDKQNNTRLDQETFPDIDDTCIKSNNNSNYSSLTPSLVEFEKNLHSIEQFISAEKVSTNKDLNYGKANSNVIS